MSKYKISKFELYRRYQYFRALEEITSFSRDFKNSPPLEVRKIIETILWEGFNRIIHGEGKIWWVELLVRQYSLFVDLVDQTVILIRMVSPGEVVASYSFSDPDCFQKMKETLDKKIPNYKRALR